MNNKKLYYKGMPVVEADKPLFVSPSPEDVKNAIPRDPNNCAFAISLKRTLHIDTVFILSTCAYVEGTGKNKGKLVHYIIGSNSPTQNYTRNFDEGETRVPIVPQWFTLGVPSPSRTLGHKKEVKIIYEGDEGAEEAIAEEPKVKIKIEKPTTKTKRPISWRNGMGMVKFDRA